MKNLLLLFALFIWLAPPALADWDPGMPAKWVQMPDLDLSGVDVNASVVPGDFVLADDFLCTQSGPITGIHIWGSWYNDFLPQQDPMAVSFQLAIYADIPASESPTGFSMPGPPLWSIDIQPGEFQARPFAQDIAEGWMDPPDFYQPPPADTVCWQYNFVFDESMAFFQEGTPEEPMVYWLGVKAFPMEDSQFGWKTSLDHWNDDATWCFGPNPAPGPWEELVYPPGHELMGYSMDLAFVLTGPAGPQELDFGDAPDPTFPTLLASNGARHVMGPLFLGSLVDAEPDGQPHPQAMGDDFANLADEDGVILMSPIIPGQSAQLGITASGPGYLNAWFDFDGDGSWAGPGEQIFTCVALSGGTTNLSFMVPAGIPGGRPAFARFRFSSACTLSYDGILPTGAVPDGEVEDYEFVVEEEYSYKWFQAPDLERTGIDVNATPSQEDYILADDFLCTERGFIEEIHVFGSWLNDMLPMGGDPSLVHFTLSIHADIPAEQNPDGYSMPGPMLWMMDFAPGTFEVRPRAEGIEEGWLDPPAAYQPPPADTVCWQYIFHIDEALAFLQEGTPDNPVVYWLDVKAFPEEPGTIFGWKTTLDHWNDDAVYGIGPEPNPGPWWELRYPPEHPLADQSIDLAFGLISTPVVDEFDYGDAPDSYGTLLASNGPQHLTGPLFLGNIVDAEGDGMPTAAADGDDTTNLDDEDGVIFVSPLKPNTTAQIDIVASQTGFLDAWIDWNADGSFGSDEQIAASWPLNLPLNHLNFTVPPVIAENSGSYARFRVSSLGGLAPTGPYTDGIIPDGEVEDYTVYLEDRYVMKWIQQPDLGPLGIDVNATLLEDGSGYILADDFLCTEQGPLTDFHVWGSWYEDILPFDGPGSIAFTLSIHKDIPAEQNPDGFSRPGELLWEYTFVPGKYRVEEFATQIEEGWLDPPYHYVFPADWTCWLYKFHVNPHEAFRQEGTPDNPVVYWLDVKAHVIDSPARFGWKTAIDHWNDDAVWCDAMEMFPEGCNELVYPPQHELQGESIDLAFALYSDLVTPAPDDGQIPHRTGLLFNVPNPFNPSTDIHFVMPEGGGHARLEVFDTRGRHVCTLVDGFVAGGPAQVTWNGRDDSGRAMPSGVYLYRLTVPEGAQSLKMLLLR